MDNNDIKIVSDENKSIDIAGNSNKGFQPKTEEEITKENKKRRTESIIGAIGDGLMSLSNLFFTTQYAPSLTTPTSDTKKQNNRTSLVSAITERHKNEDALYNEKYKAWEKEQDRQRKAQEKENEKNRKYMLNDTFGIKESNWMDSDYIEQAYQYIIANNDDEKMLEQLNPYFLMEVSEYSNNGDKIGTSKTPFKQSDKRRRYMERALIEDIINEESWTSPENRENIKSLLQEFDANWKKIK